MQAKLGHRPPDRPSVVRGARRGNQSPYRGSRSRHCGSSSGRQSSVGQDRSPANGLRKSGCRDDYNVIAISMTHVNPTFIARSVARIALSTEAQPLMPQAQGTNPGAQAEMRDRPKRQAGAINSNAMAIFGASGRATSSRNSGAGSAGRAAPQRRCRRPPGRTLRGETEAGRASPCIAPAAGRVCRSRGRDQVQSLECWLEGAG